MKLNSDTIATIFGAIAASAQLLGQSGVIDPTTSGTISAIAIALLGWISNKPKTSLN